MGIAAMRTACHRMHIMAAMRPGTAMIIGIMAIPTMNMLTTAVVDTAMVNMVLPATITEVMISSAITAITVNE